MHEQGCVDAWLDLVDNLDDQVAKAESALLVCLRGEQLFANSDDLLRC